LAIEERTMIFYESPHKLLKTLQDFNQYFGVERKASISRELTKLYEENIQGTFNELIVHFQKNVLKGEFVIVVGGRESK